MRIGILTFPNSTSHGASLQMYALYRTTADMGYDVEIMNYHNAYMKSNLHCARMQKQSKPVRAIKLKLNQLIHCRQYMGFRRFESRMTKFPEKPVSDKTRLPEIGSRYGAVICGSDQVWNPDITDADLSYFLDFCGPETARISYAPSFGVETLPESLGHAAGEELKRFFRISVREESGRQLIRQIACRDAQLVVDPTLLMDAREWMEHETAHPAAKGEYILYYTVRSSDSLWRYCKNLAKKHNLKILRIGSNVISKHLKRSDGVEYVCDVSPDEWLYLVHHACCVVTNSFHGTAFSINYRKNFFVELSSLTNSRLSHIVSVLGLEDRIVKNEEASLPLETDYSQTERVLPTLRGESLEYLRRALKEAFEKNEEIRHS